MPWLAAYQRASRISPGNRTLATYHPFTAPALLIRISHRTSKCVDVIYVDPVKATVEVAFTGGSIYRYTHVSRRAILNLLINPLISLGLWVNHNLTAYDSKTATWGTYTKLDSLFS
jgi:hypothetical protein